MFKMAETNNNKIPMQIINSHISEGEMWFLVQSHSAKWPNSFELELQIEEENIFTWC